MLPVQSRKFLATTSDGDKAWRRRSRGEGWHVQLCCTSVSWASAAVPGFLGKLRVRGFKQGAAENRVTQGVRWRGDLCKTLK